MLSARFKPWHVPLFAAKYAYLHVRRFPVLVHFEVTMRCNARCDFCDYWKNGADATRSDAESYAEAARYFNPVMITFTGGEPLLRRDLEELIAAVARAIRVRYLAMITHGAMLTPERARSLWEAGLNQFNISLDYLDERHDAARGIPGLAAKILDTVPRMRAIGIDGIRFNTVIKRSNLDQLVPLVRCAEELGIGVSFSTYTDAKNGNTAHLVSRDEQQHLEEVIARAAGIQASPARRDRELGLLSRAGAALLQRRDARLLQLRRAHDPHRSRGTGAALPRFSVGLSLARLQALHADRLQRVLLRVPRRGAGAAHDRARARRDGDRQ